MNTKSFVVGALLAVSGVTVANASCDVDLNLPSGGKATVVCKDGNSSIKKTNNSNEKLKKVESYTVKKGQGLAGALGNNNKARKAAADLGLKIMKSDGPYAEQVKVPIGYKFSLWSDGKYRKD